LDNIDWELGTAITAGVSIGDHSFGTASGHLIYIDTSSLKPKEEVN
jgi:hypothetical protein